MYRSPIRLAGLSATGTGFDRQTLSLARKKMLAELELGDGHSIIVEGTELNRQDIARLFDELGNEQELSYHTAIYNDPALLGFLEDGALKPDGNGWQQHELYDSPGFRSFVSPYFAAAMSAMFQKILSGAAGSGMLTKFLRQRSFLQPADHEAAYAKLTRYFLEIKNRIIVCQHRIEHPGDTNVPGPATQAKLTKEEIENLCNDYDIFVLNQLPEEFDDLRYTIVDELNDLCVLCDHSERPALAYAAISKAAAINCESLHELVQKNKAVVYNKMQPRQFRTNAQPKKEQPMRWIGLIVFLFITVIRLAGSSGCNQKTESNLYRSYSNVSYVNKESFSSNGKVDNNSVAHMNTYRNLVAALNGISKDSLLVLSNNGSDATIHLLHSEKNGADVLAPVWRALSMRTRDSMPAGDNTYAGVAINNRSAWPAIVMFVIDEQYFGSVYVPANDQYKLRYNGSNVYVDICSGTKWSDKEKITTHSYINGELTTPLHLVGGFKQHATYIKSAENAFFYRSKEAGESFNDVIIIEDNKETGTGFTQIRDVAQGV